MASVINIGDRIELTKVSNAVKDSSNEEQVKYVSRVLEKNNDYEMKIAMPIQGGRVIPLAVGDTFMSCFFSGPGSIYEARIKVTDRYKQENLFVLEIEVISQLKKVQRRNFYRFSCMLPMYYINVNMEDEEETSESNDSKVWKQAVAMDISGGGIRIASKIKEEEGSCIEIKLHLINESEKSLIYMKAKIIRVLSSSQKGVYELRGEFVDILEADREEIIKYIFDMERKKRQLEKGLT